ncbi:MAG: alpha/beta hydrolase [Rhodobacteraceae bacterium]|nr:alpha/beta hydrolase [Paracoccaceae bacterium]
MTSYSYFKSSDGLRLAYRIGGSGPPLLCLAGLSRHSAEFDYIRQRLHGVTYICPDYRGRGRSDWDRNPDNYVAPIEARDAVELLDHLGIASTPILGTSRGGIIAALLAGVTASRVSGVILNDIGPKLEIDGLDRIGSFIGRRPSVGSLAEAAERMPEYRQGFADVPASRWLEEVERNYLERQGRLKLRYDPELRQQFMLAVESGQLEMWDLFDSLKDLPFLLLRGNGSDLLSERTASQMQERWPHMEHCEVPGRGHCPFLDEPESLEAIASFLRNVGHADCNIS